MRGRTYLRRPPWCRLPLCLTARALLRQVLQWKRLPMRALLRGLRLLLPVRMPTRFAMPLLQSLALFPTLTNWSRVLRIWWFLNERLALSPALRLAPSVVYAPLALVLVLRPVPSVVYERLALVLALLPVQLAVYERLARVLAPRPAHPGVFGPLKPCSRQVHTRGRRKAFLKVFNAWRVLSRRSQRPILFPQRILVRSQVLNR